MMIRFFADVDETSESSRFALTYCRALVTLQRAMAENTRSMLPISIRLIPTGVAALQPAEDGREVSRWAHHRALLGTPLESAFVNVVCCPDPGRFWTKGARNVLIAPDARWTGTYANPKWEAIIVPAAEHVSELVGATFLVTVFGPGSPLGVLYDVLFPSG